MRLGSRGSDLALAQVSLAEAILDTPTERKIVVTQGDAGNRKVVGAFVKDLQDSLLAGEFDVAVHSLKDLPTAPVAGLAIGAYLKRGDPRDAILSRKGNLAELPPDANMGTGSLRRQSQIARLRPDLKFENLEGNVDSRIKKLFSGQYDAIVLAVAGVDRLGFLTNHQLNKVFEDRFGLEQKLTWQPLDSHSVVPAPGQGIIALEVRSDDENTSLAILDAEDRDAQATGTAERSFLHALGGGCSVPIAAYAAVEGDTLRIFGRVSSVNGKEMLDGTAVGSASHADEVGQHLAFMLIRQGAMDILAEVKNLYPDLW